MQLISHLRRYDYSCLPQGVRTEEEEALFRSTLGAIADLYMTSRVLILLDEQYYSRFWTLMEAWCSMQTATVNGVRPAKQNERRFCLPAKQNEGRFTIKCLHNTSEDPILNTKKLIRMLWKKSPNEMRDKLAKPDILLTNAKRRNSASHVS